MGNITPRQLFDSAIAAGLAMRGLFLEKRPLPNEILRVYAEYEINQYCGDAREASLADVEAAVEACLNNGGTGFTESTPNYDRVGKRHIFVRPVWVEWCYGNASGEDGFQAFELGTGDNGGEELSAITKVYPTRAAALKAACDALAKGKV